MMTDWRDGLVCDDCEATVDHLTKCKDCGEWVCDWCIGHVHTPSRGPQRHAAPSAPNRSGR